MSLLECPRCHTVLERTDLEEADIHTQAHRCPNCEGQYFSSGRLEPVKDVVKVDMFARPKVPGKKEQLRPLTCPKCGAANAMEKVPSPRDKNVLMDVCRTCGGTWLDKGELDAIQKQGLLRFLYDTFIWITRS